jgi:cobalt-zinc-cadmium efflux system outer membrane protein
MALQHNHALRAAETTIAQNEAQEVTAGLRPNPVLSWDAQFLPLFHPSDFSSDYINNSAQFDVGLGYLFELGNKRDHRMKAARDQTSVTRSQVADNERALTFNVAQQFVGALLAESDMQFAEEALKSFQYTVDISEIRYKAGDMSEGDLLKIKLQLLQFQMDVSSARLAKVQALAALRQLLGHDAVAPEYDVVGELRHEDLTVGRQELDKMAIDGRPDLLAAKLSVAAADSQFTLAKANSWRDLTASFNYTHAAGTSTGAFFFNIPIPLFDRNQGEVARTKVAITQAQETLQEASETVLTDVTNAYESLQTNVQIVQLYQSAYLQQAQASRDIAEYAYKRGAASLLDFLDAERSYRSVQLAYRQALASDMLALEQLREAVGTRKLP